MVCFDLFLFANPCSSLRLFFLSAALAKASHLNRFFEEIMMVVIFLFGLLAIYFGKSVISSPADGVEERFHLGRWVFVDDYEFALLVKHLLS